MKRNLKTMDPEELFPPLLALLDDTPAVPLVISGYSMTPFLLHGRDTVYFSKITQPPQRGDMVLYRRDNGSYVLHRVYEAGSTYTMVGDAQTLLEQGIRPDQMLAQVSAVCRKGKKLQKGSFWWEFFEKVWIRNLSIRPTLISVYCHMRKLFN